MTTTALDTYDLATYSQEHGKWISALMCSIALDTKHNEGRNTGALASLGQHLADDLQNYMRREAERIKQEEGFH
ncbi:hypothetical protein AX279_22470 [Pseudomonas sp. J237]|nr:MULTISPECIES: hypothetical protein [Pseudomonas]OEO23093.1 hypothetical protein AX279_22470 [Pseudomonas sp. J237]